MINNGQSAPHPLFQFNFILTKSFCLQNQRLYPDRALDKQTYASVWELIFDTVGQKTKTRVKSKIIVKMLLLTL